MPGCDTRRAFAKCTSPDPIQTQWTPSLLRLLSSVSRSANHAAHVLADSPAHSRILSPSGFPSFRFLAACLYHAIQDFISPRIPVLFAARFTQTKRRSTSRLRLSPRPFHRSYHPIARRRGQRNKFIVCPRQRKAVFVLTPRRIWSQRRNAHAVFHLYRSCIPLLRRPVILRWRPTFDVPSIRRRIFRNLPQFNGLSKYVSVRIAIYPPSTDPAEPASAPNHPKVRLTQPVCSTGMNKPLTQTRRRIMCLSCYSYHCNSILKPQK